MNNDQLYDDVDEWPGCLELAAYPILALAAVAIGLWGRTVDSIRRWW